MNQLSLLLGVAAILFSVGIYLVITQKNTIVMLMGIELMLNAANLNLVAFGKNNQETDGGHFALFVIVVAACEAAVGLAVVLRAYRFFKTVDPDKFSEMKG